MQNPASGNAADSTSHAGWRERSLLTMRTWLRDALEFCYPAVCLTCREFCPDGGSLCASCGGEIDRLAAIPACDLCGCSTAYHGAPCAHCQGEGVPHFDRLVRMGPFDSHLRTLIHQLKFHRQWTVGELLADRLFTQDRVEALLLDADCLLPVPLHARRQFHRGYNQSHVIASRLSRFTGLPVVGGIIRCRSTEPQSGFHHRAARMSNLRGAFRLTDPTDLTGRRVVVIDDVFTTGATLQTFGRALRPAKPATLSALVLAVSQPHGQEEAIDLDPPSDDA